MLPLLVVLEQKHSLISRNTPSIEAETRSLFRHEHSRVKTAFLPEEGDVTSPL